jgi:hypothetical protein
MRATKESLFTGILYDAAGTLNEILGGGEFTIGLPQIASVECPFRHVRQGRAVRLVVGDTNITTDASRQAIPKPSPAPASGTSRS